MNLRTVAQRIIKDPAYQRSLVARANAGTLPPGVEELLWELADGRVPVSVDARPPVRTATLHVIPPPDPSRHT